MPLQAFSRPKGTFSAQVHNLLAVVLGVGVGVAGLYISLWDGRIFSIPFISEQKDSYTVAGLQNLGNNCFLNVILQALSSSSCFLSFLQNILLSGDPVIGEKIEKMPLTVALSSLLEGAGFSANESIFKVCTTSSSFVTFSQHNVTIIITSVMAVTCVSTSQRIISSWLWKKKRRRELHILRDEKSVLNPRKVMLAMSSYVSSFNLTRQQDAAEAFLHLLSALEEEIAECYVLHDISLADITAFPSKIHKPNREGQNECERWKQQFLGPFDGTIGSSLTCKSCSSMLSMDLEFFRCLPLSPVLDRRAEIMAGCTVMDCFKHFTAVEHVENYRCSRCWHAAALKYLSGKGEKDEEKSKKLDHCVNLESCDCNRIFLQEEITWTGFSCASKQLSIARCPRILCIHLQRASMNEHGEFIKLQGHISFPLFLDLFPYTRVNVGQGTSEDCIQTLEKQQPNLLMSQLHNLKMQQKIHMLPHIYRIVNDKLSSEILSRNMLRKSTSEAFGHPPNETASGDNNRDWVAGSGIFASDVHGPQAGSISGTGLNDEMHVSSIDSSKQCMYRLSSVVEHYGRPGSGHYAVYRRLGSEIGLVASVGRSETADCQWFYVSDREVSAVSEETVLAAEASLLFYEIIDANTISDCTALKTERGQLQPDNFQL